MIHYYRKKHIILCLKTLIQFELILNETKPTDLSIEEYKTALVSGKIVLSLNQQNKILKATEPLIDYSTKLAKMNSISIDDLSSKIALGGLYSPNDNLNSKFNTNSFQVYNESPIKKSNEVNSKQIMKNNLETNEVLDCALAAIGADALFASVAQLLLLGLLQQLQRHLVQLRKDFLVLLALQ